MRPRPDAAENDLIGDRLSLIALASMRPRPDAAENAGQHSGRRPGVWSLQ